MCTQYLPGDLEVANSRRIRAVRVWRRGLTNNKRKQFFFEKKNQKTFAMCGRFSAQLPPELLRQLFLTRNPLVNAAPSWNVAPTDPAMVVRHHKASAERRLDILRWGLVPHFTKGSENRPPPHQRARGNHGLIRHVP